MEYLKVFLADPVVGLIGYAIGVVSGLIALAQTLGKAKAKKQVNEVEAKLTSITQENVSLKQKIENMNVTQGDKSQYFQQNSGAVSIDNRG
ncbi:hypothetical protein V2J66_18000 [Pseudomonas alliivorans]|nr:hypothetical protein [Pseudomonas alliivorans]MEE5126387.1 hypothetical protein [Pseudomonas alliivorans]MEE5162486.1 hypothetical protein [Pseudomonas alliivorans]